MYLKNIEVQGFKSFANKIKFDFHKRDHRDRRPERERKEQCGRRLCAGCSESRESSSSAEEICRT